VRRRERKIEVYPDARYFGFYFVGMSRSYCTVTSCRQVGRESSAPSRLAVGPVKLLVSLSGAGLGLVNAFYLQYVHKLSFPPPNFKLFALITISRLDDCPDF